MNLLRIFRRQGPPLRDRIDYPNSMGLTQSRILDDLREQEPQSARMLASRQPDVTTVSMHLYQMVDAGLVSRFR